MKKRIKRNTKHLLYFLPYPTFIISIFKKGKKFYKCIHCKSLFPTKFRLSRHLRAKILSKKRKFSKNNQITNPQKDEKQNLNIDIQYSDFFHYEQELLSKKQQSCIIKLDTSQEGKGKNNKNKLIDDTEKKNESEFINIYNKKISKRNCCIGEGYFSIVYSCYSENNKGLVALKYSKKKGNELRFESIILKKMSEIHGVPIFIDFINEINEKILVHNLFGPTIEKLFWFCGKNFDDKTILQIGIDSIKILKNIHLSGVVHRDIKPSNICYGFFSSKNNKFNKSITIIDFGLSKINKRIINRKYNLQKKDYFIGTLIFASNAALYGFEQYPKDDLESLFYTLIYLKNGTLPWINSNAETNLEYLKEILRIRNNISLNELFKGFPLEIKYIFKALKNLSINETPDYDVYIKNMENALNSLYTENKTDDYKFIWQKKFRQIISDFKNLKISEEQLMKIAFLKKGYPINIEEYLNLL